MNHTETKRGHSIRIVSRRTGLSPDVIRAWERRHGVVEPRRSESRRRLFSDADVERLRLLRQVTAAGRRISDVAKLSTAELNALTLEDGQETAPAVAPTTASLFLTQCQKAVERLDVARLKENLSRASVELGISELLEGVLVPLLKDVGERWQRGELRIYHEHLATAAVRSLLDSLRAALPGRNGAPGLIVTTPTGQHHELGALTTALIANAEGWRTHYFGPDMPAAEIAGAATLHRTSAVLLSITYSPELAETREALEAIIERLPPEVTLVVGGRATAELGLMLQRSGVIVPADLADLRLELGRLHRRALTRSRPLQ